MNREVLIEGQKHEFSEDFCDKNFLAWMRNGIGEVMFECYEEKERGEEREMCVRICVGRC